MGFFLLSQKITGNVIGNISANSSNIVGAILFFIGIISLTLSYIKRQVKN